MNEMQNFGDNLDTKENVRQGLIAWRDAAMKSDEPSWDNIVLLSHAIGWLTDEK